MGGGPGHMRHPHDLHFVKNGSKLIELFGKIKTSIESLKTTPNGVRGWKRITTRLKASI